MTSPQAFAAGLLGMDKTALSEGLMSDMSSGGKEAARGAMLVKAIDKARRSSLPMDELRQMYPKVIPHSTHSMHNALAGPGGALAQDFKALLRTSTSMGGRGIAGARAEDMSRSQVSGMLSDLLRRDQIADLMPLKFTATMLRRGRKHLNMHETTPRKASMLGKLFGIGRPARISEAEVKARLTDALVDAMKPGAVS